jgi:hypothetical protein
MGTAAPVLVEGAAEPEAESDWLLESEEPEPLEPESELELPEPDSVEEAAVPVLVMVVREPDTVPVLVIVVMEPDMPVP